MKLIGIFVGLILWVGFASAISVCIDNTLPSNPSNLSVSGDASSRALVWGAATDEPDCSGIDEYVISRKGVEIGRVDGDVLSFTDDDNLGKGKYIYSVYAIDLIGHNGGKAIANEFEIGSSGGGGGSGSSSSSYVCEENWTCEEWTECVGNDMRRLCSDVNECGTELEKPETYQVCGESSESNMTLESEDVKVDDASPIVKAFLAITGAVVGGGTGSVIGGGIFLILVIGGLVIVVRKKRKQ